MDTHRQFTSCADVLESRIFGYSLMCRVDEGAKKRRRFRVVRRKANGVMVSATVDRRYVHPKRIRKAVAV